MADTTEQPRKVRVIAAEIAEKWTNPYFGAVPYIDAMKELDTPQDTLITEQGSDIINRFLLNAGTWRGADARRIKAELKAMIGRK